MSTKMSTVADVVKAVSAGRMGNRAAIEALALNNYQELVETVHLNGYTMAAHRPIGDRQENAALIAEACGRLRWGFPPGLDGARLTTGEEFHENLGAVAHNAAIALAVSLSSEAVAQTSIISGKANFDLQFDCERPFLVRDHPISPEVTALLNADKSASADAITGTIFTNKVHFDARLGAASQSAPGGTSSLRVMASNHLRAIWSLPNNQIIVDFVAAGRSCSATLGVRLKPGMREYTMFDGSLMYYCSRQRCCEAHANELIRSGAHSCKARRSHLRRVRLYIIAMGSGSRCSPSDCAATVMF